MSSSGWKTYKLGDLYNVFSGLSKSRDQFGFGHPFVTFKDVFDNYFLPGNLSSLANTTEKEIRSCSVRKGDVFLTRTSETQEDLGMSSVALKDYPNATFNGFTKRLRLKEDVKVDVDPLFVGYYLRSPQVRRQIGQHSSLTTRASLNSAAINSLEIALPKISIQSGIGKILKSLDDKIELNRQTNATLEAIVQALFKDWFVDFNYTGATGGKVESELGRIPKGWKAGSISDVLSLYKETVNPSLEPEVLFEHYSLPAFDTDRMPGNEEGWTILSNKFRVKSKSILVSKLNPRIPRIWPIIDIDEEVSICSTEFQVLQPKKEFYYTFAANVFGQSSIIEIMKGRASGTSSSHQRIRPEDILNIEIVMPSDEILSKYNLVCDPMYHQMALNKKQNQTLTQLRDSLLPRLMKGDINTIT